MSKPIPISAAKEIAEKFDYDQVIIVARKVGGNEHVTTYGRDKDNCKVAADIGDFLKFKVMGWVREEDPQMTQAVMDFIPPEIKITRGAIFSPCNLYRYTLWRTWDASKPHLCFIMLNPSTADAEKNDPTVERCQRRAAQTGFGAVQVLNVFAFRATDPDDMKRASDPVGPENDGYLARAAASAKANGVQLIAAWGHHAQHMDRERHVLKMMRHFGVDLYCLGVTKDGHPRHPLYVGYDVVPQVYRGTV